VSTPDPSRAGLDSAIAGRFDRVGLGLIVFAVILVVALALTGGTEAAAALWRLGLPAVLTLFVLAGAHYVLRWLRWHLIVQAAGLPLTPRQTLRHFFGGFAMTATPGRIGELVRLRWMRRDTGQGLARLLPVALADRAIELAAILFPIALGLIATGLGTSAVWWLVAVATCLVWVACRPRLVEAAVLGLWRIAGRRRTRAFVRARRLARNLAPFMRLPVLIPTLALGIVGWTLEGVAFWLLLDWLGHPIGLAAATAIFLVAVLGGALSGLPGGLGGTEATAVALLLLQGVPADTAILATALIRVATLWFAVGIGLVVFPLAEARAGRVAL
jgi:uncharacterized protein (TIRG00374 family)